MKKYLSVPVTYQLPDRRQVFWDMAMIGIIAICLAPVFIVPHADNFTDIFYTNSFRGTFEWLNKVDWLGKIVQGVISIFSILGVSLIAIRVLSSMLVISSRGLWEEVHELKQAGGGGEMYDFGVIGMAKTWVSGKAGTGLDAIIGALLILAPDIMKYSDFGEKSGMQLEQDISMSQYMLKIAIPVTMAVFFFAMGFNGTLWKFFATTVDGMGTIADHAVSVNYSAIVNDLVNSKTGYAFTLASDGTERGKYMQKISTDVYGRVVSLMDNPDTAALNSVGLKVEEAIPRVVGDALGNANTSISSDVINGLKGDDADRYYKYLGFQVEMSPRNISDTSGVAQIALSELMPENFAATKDSAEQYIYIYPRQTTNFNGSYFNTDSIKR